MFIIIMASGVVDKLHLSLHDPIQAGQAGPPDHSIRFVRTHLLGVMWETEERWNSSISESDSLTRPVEVLLSEVLTAEPGRLTGSETFPSQGYFPLLPQHLIFGKPAGCGIYYLFYFIQAGNTPEGLKKKMPWSKVSWPCQVAPQFTKLQTKRLQTTKKASIATRKSIKKNQLSMSENL